MSVVYFNMGNKKFIYCEEDDMKWGHHHPPGTLVITTNGPNANKMSCAYMYSIPAGVGPNGVATLSRFESKKQMVHYLNRGLSYSPLLYPAWDNFHA